MVIMFTQGCRLRSNPGLELANAFGVYRAGFRRILANAFGVYRVGFRRILANAFGVYRAGFPGA
jgi:predicted outer membrane lipoprotein